MSETEGWRSWVSMAGPVHEKCINGLKFRVVDRGDAATLKVDGSDDLATRERVRDCMELAHATAQLWDGEKE